MHLLQLMPFTFFQFSFHQVPILAGWAEAVWYERFMPNISTYELRSVIFWELVNLPCAAIGVGDCEANQTSWHKALWFMNVILEAPLLMHYHANLNQLFSQPFVALLCLHLETNAGLRRDRQTSSVTLAKKVEVSAKKTILAVCISPKSPPSHTKSPGKSEHGK